ncbi:D-2-hydroxyacid dehydrogenase family protein [archaeon]|nr:MAG: D-2-hydroxyacid dehydrogenase family protein [archaeon]
MKIALLDDYQGVAGSIVDWQKLGPRFEIRTFQAKFSTEENLVDSLYPFDIIVVMRERTAFPRSVISKLPNLNLLITTGMRNTVIDLEAATFYHVAVCGTRSLSEPTAELTWGLILSLARNIPQEYNNLRSADLQAPWQSSMGTGLHGKTLGILGLGKLGTRVARIGKALGMKVLAWSQNLTRETTDSEEVELAYSKEDLLQRSDFISIHLVLSERTRNLISFKDYRHIRPAAYLINTSRSGIVHEAALIDALVNNRIAGAAVDVFDEEPLPAHHVFRRLPNVIATPHLGYVTTENYKVFYEDVLENILAYTKGQVLRPLN